MKWSTRVKHIFKNMHWSCCLLVADELQRAAENEKILKHIEKV